MRTTNNIAHFIDLTSMGIPSALQRTLNWKLTMTDLEIMVETLVRRLAEERDASCSDERRKQLALAMELGFALADTLALVPEAEGTGS